MNIFDKKEVNLLQNEVIRYKELENGIEKERLKENLIKKNTYFLYFIPSHLLIDEEDIASEVYTSLIGSIDSILESYNTSGLLYATYLMQISKFKALSLYRRLDNNQIRRNTSIIEDNMIDLLPTETVESVEECALSYGIYRPEVELLPLDKLILYIVNHRDNSGHNFFSKKEEMLYNVLKKKHYRLKFIVFLLHLDDSSDNALISYYARVLDLDYKVIGHLFHLKHDLILDKLEKKEMNLNLANKYWNIVIRSEKNLALAQDEKKKKALELTLNRAKTLQKKKLMEANKPVGLTLIEIKNILKISKSTVWKYIEDIRRVLIIIKNYQE